MGSVIVTKRPCRVILTIFHSCATFFPSPYFLFSFHLQSTTINKFEYLLLALVGFFTHSRRGESISTSVVINLRRGCRKKKFCRC
jgi:hypothetical protein